MASKQKQKERKEPWLETYKYVLVFSFAVLIYLNSVPNNYCMDDELVTTIKSDEPHRLTSEGISAIPKIFTEPYYKDNQGYAYDYRPVVLTTFAIEHSLFGDNPHTSHFINVILYGLLCVVLLSTLCSLFNSYSIILPVLSTLIFAAHPIHTEVVDSIKNRDEILALLFGLISISLLLKAVLRNNIALLLGAILCVVLSLFSKSTSISLIVLSPVAILLFYRTKLIPLFVYVISGIAVFSVISSSLRLITLTKIAGAVILFILLVYVITNYSSLVAEFKAFVSRRRNTNSLNIAEQDDSGYRILNLNISQLLLAGFVMGAASFLCYFLEYPFYLIPIAAISFFPFFYKGSNKWLIPVFHGLVVVFLVWITRNDILTSVFGLQMIYMYFIRKRNEYAYALLAYLVFCFVIQEPTWKLHLPLFIAMYGAYRTSRFALAKYSPVLVTVIVYAVDLFNSPGFFLNQRIYNLDIINGFIIIVIAVLPGIRKYLPLIIVLQILTTTALNNTQRHFTPYKSEIIHVVETATPPSIIDKKNIDRPINFIESFINEQSLLKYKLGVTAQVFRKYAQLLVVPYPMSFYYGYKVIDKQSVFEPINLITILFYLMLFLLALYFIRSNAVVALGILAYLISISIYSNLFLTAPGMMADRFLFVPSLGFSILLAYGLIKVFKIDLFSKSAVNLTTVPANFKYALLGVLSVYSLLTVARNRQWENHLTLFAADIEHLQQSAQANNLYALQLMKYSFAEADQNKKNEMWQNAATYFAKAIALYPEFFNAQYDLARVQGMLKQNQQAEQSFYKAALLDSSFASTWLSAGELALNDKRITNARFYYAQGLKHIKNNPTLYSQLGLTYYMEQKYDSAILVSKLGMAAFPQNPDFPSNIAKTFLAMNNRDSTLYYLNQTLVLSPGNQSIQNAIETLKQTK